MSCRAVRCGLVAALLAVGCSDALTPRPPSFAGEAADGAIALWGFNGTLPPQSGTEIGKEFNPENPPLGSTVVATFVWVGSSNIIDSVADYLWTGRRVGNTYTLVEYVTSGGISMATYAATNAQNYPVPKTRLGDELIINAYLRTPTSAGGALVSAYTGAPSVGVHRSAFGSGSTTPTNAHPGAITVNAGALVYAVSMSSDGNVGREAPAGYTYITGLAAESPSIQIDAEYAVQTSAGAVDPMWGWSFQSTHTWLASALALDPTGAPPSNQPPLAAFSWTCNALACTFTNGSSDPDGTIAAYSWALGDGATSSVQNPSHTYAAGGTRTVTLTVTDNQGAATSVSHSVTVTAANQPPTAAFSFSCTQLTCGFASTSTDPDGTIASHNWTLGDGASSATQNPSHTYGASGTYTVTLLVTDNQGATSATSENVSVTNPPPPPPGGIAYDTDNGTLSQQGIQVLIKGFNPRNPHLGDAIVATFIWSGPAVITSVTDVLTNADFTLVGNTYHLVDQVSAGGYTMATYVATNVQNFPDPNPDNNVVLAVRATLSQTFADGGIKLTAWSGVAPTFAAALGQFRSASGASPRDTVVGPGATAVNPGALTVAVTAATAPVGRDPPPGFIRFLGSVQTDAFLAIETNYQVPATGSVDPRWFWAFSQAGGATVTWLATVLSLNTAP